MQPQTNSVNDYLKVGLIVGVHGIQGMLKIKSFTTNPNDIIKYGKLYDHTKSKEFDIKIVSTAKTNLLARIKNINDRTTAETLIGTELYIKKENLPATNENEYYYCDLIGMQVIDTNGQIYGQVITVQNFGAGDILEIQHDHSKKKIMHSFKNEIFPQIDLIKKIIIIKNS
jgi:16S rRNA processing protein RimM